MTLATTWLELESDSRANTGFCSRRITEPVPCAVYVAVEKPSNNRALLVVGRVPLEFKLPESRGLVVRSITPSVGGTGTVTLAVVLRDAAFAEVFDVIVADITVRLGVCTSETQAMDAVVERVALWQLFLEKQGEGGLRREEQVGLFGELWFLQTVLIPRVGAGSALRSWLGPGGANQDFQFGPLAFEVKATVAKQHQRMQIANERQLDTTGLEDLIVVHLSLDERRGAGTTLPAMVDAVRAAVAGNVSALMSLEDGLRAAGFLPEMAHRYLSAGYTEREHHFMEVKGAFPRLTETGLMKGVGEVRYSIGVAECLHYEIPAATVDRHLAATLK